jgi:molecular chaperone DnaK (HSP70)
MMEMKRVPWAVAGAVVILTLGAIAAVVLPGQRPTAVRPAELWGETPRHWVGTAETNPGPGYYVLEQDSPIVGADSKLVEALGFESPPGTFKTVLPEGTPTPVGRVVTFRTGADNQTEIRLHILRGRSEGIPGNHSLGWVRFAGLPAGPRGQARVAVAFQMVDFAILLAAQNPEDGRPIQIAASEQPPGFIRP